MKLWWFKLNELRSTVKMRILGFCDKKGCWNLCRCKHIRWCILHIPHESIESYYMRDNCFKPMKARKCENCRYLKYIVFKNFPHHCKKYNAQIDRKTLERCKQCIEENGSQR